MRAVLMYHSVDETGSPISMSPDEFRAHVDFFVSGAVRVRSLSDLLAGNATSDEHAVALTFDDAVLNFATEVAPVLGEHGLPVTLFVVPGHVGQHNRWGGTSQSGIPDLPLLDWDALGVLADGGGVDIGAHTRTHPHLTRCSTTAVEEELLGSADDLARHLGRRPATFSYPYGDCNDAVVEVAGRTFQWACTTQFRALHAQEHPARIPRLDACALRGRGRLERWGTRAFNLELQLRATARRTRRLWHAD